MRVVQARKSIILTRTFRSSQYQDVDFFPYLHDNTLSHLLLDITRGQRPIDNESLKATITIDWRRTLPDDSLSVCSCVYI